MAKPHKCGVCGMATEAECSHIDCPNRRPLTAAPLRSSDGKVPPRNSNLSMYLVRHKRGYA